MVEIAVVGSVNMDAVMQVDELPRPGETVSATGYFENPGGKGANQAVAAARLGRSVAIVGAVGDDEAGTALRQGLEIEGVDTSHLETMLDIPSGMALITVDSDGMNTILVRQGANAQVDPEMVSNAEAVLADAKCLLLQLEIPIRTVETAVERFAGTVVLNPAPSAPLEPDLLARVDVLVPNESELGALLGVEPPRGPLEAIEMAESVEGPEAIAVTLGQLGAVVLDGVDAHHVKAPEVEAIDTTAAGDAFCGALADALVGGGSLVDAVRWGVAAGSVAATRRGAQGSLPTQEQVEALTS